MQPHQQRVVTEKEELDDKLTKLKAFLDGQNSTDPNAIKLSIPKDELDRLEKQKDIMQQYSDVLGERIANF